MLSESEHSFYSEKCQHTTTGPTSDAHQKCSYQSFNVSTMKLHIRVNATSRNREKKTFGNFLCKEEKSQRGKLEKRAVCI